MNRADQRKFHYLYKTTCLITDRYYIGIHSTDNLKDGYIGSGKRLWLSIKKHGKENHTLEILEMLSGRKALCEREKEVVTTDLLDDPLCMNLITGGGEAVGFRGSHSEETKQRIRAKLQVRTFSDEHRQKISDARRGKSTWSKGKRLSSLHRKNIGDANRGKKMSPEMKEKMSQIRKGKKLSLEHRRRISEGHLRRKVFIDEGLG